MKTIHAKPISYSSKARDKKGIKYIVIHYTGNRGDTALNNCRYFANGNTTRQAGAHFFVDRQGEYYKSIKMMYTAWAVGGDHRTGRTGEARYYKKCTNFNSVSIELCDIVNKYPSKKQIEATKKVIKHIRKYCPNAKTVIRHFDVNGKFCPESMLSEKTWEKFLKDIGEKKC